MKNENEKTKMDELFQLKGCFYKDEKNKNSTFRKLMVIKRKDVDNLKKNDLSVIMMNPGSAKQTDEYQDVFDKLVDTIPDDTQYQIMEIMDRDNLKFNYAIIINLSDFVEPKSKEFYKIPSDKKKEYSTFYEKNNNLLRKHINPESIFILAWGVNEKMSEIAQQAIVVLTKLFGNNIKIVGVKHPLSEYGYYHPLQRNPKYQEKWVEVISEQIETILQNQS